MELVLFPCSLDLICQLKTGEGNGKPAVFSKSSASRAACGEPAEDLCQLRGWRDIRSGQYTQTGNAECHAIVIRLELRRYRCNASSVSVLQVMIDCRLDQLLADRVRFGVMHTDPETFCALVDARGHGSADQGALFAILLTGNIE